MTLTITTCNAMDCATHTRVLVLQSCIGTFRCTMSSWSCIGALWTWHKLLV